MRSTTIPLVEYIEVFDEVCDVYVYTKDKRIIVIDDVRSEGLLDDSGLYVDHWFMGKRMSVFIPRDDFSYLEYGYRKRKRTTKEDFDDMHSFIEEQFKGDDSYIKGYYQGATSSGKYHDELVKWIGDDLV